FWLIFKKEFNDTFIAVTVISFSPGSIITAMEATFKNLLSDVRITDIITNSNTTFNITSVNVTITTSPTSTTITIPTTTTTSSTTTTTTTSPTTTTTTTSPTTTTTSPTTTTTSPTTTTTTTSPTTTTTSPTTTTTTTSPTTTTTTTSPTTTTTSPTTTTTSPTTTTTSPTTTTTSPTTTTTTTSPTTTTTSPTTTTTSPTTTTTTTSPTTTTTTTSPTTTTTTTSPTTTTAKPTTTQTTTTITPTTTTTQPPYPQPTVALQVVIKVEYVLSLQNSTSPEFITLATKIEAEFDVVYKTKYGDLFIKTVVLAFISVSKTRAEQKVQADIKLVFNEKSTETIPSSTAIVETLKEAATAQKSTFNLTVDTKTIIVVKSPQTSPVIILTDGTFVTALSNKSSPGFQNRATMIKTGLEPFFFADYPGSFSSLTITNFSDAGVRTKSIPTIRNSIDLTFTAEAILPNSNQIVNTIVRAAKNNSLPFQIFTSEIVINSTAFSSCEVSNKISVLTALILVTVSLLVPWFD
ncbi:hypothetical protein ABG768_024612, partial [Culter alburnus]